MCVYIYICVYIYVCIYIYIYIFVVLTSRCWASGCDWWRKVHCVPDRMRRVPGSRISFSSEKVPRQAAKIGLLAM